MSASASSSGFASDAGSTHHNGSGAGLPHTVMNSEPSLGIRSRSDTIAVISHELRNSLGVVRNATRLLRVQVGADGIQHARVLIDRHVEQMNRHIEDLLDISPHTRRRDVLRLSHLDLRTVLENSLEAIAPDLARRGHHLVVHLPPDAFWVHVDGTRLEQAFTNLLTNAAKYTPDGGEITVNMQRSEKGVSVCIRDSGIGIPPSLLSRIFDLFVQVDATANLGEGGRGIGLAVVRDVVELHGGSVRAVSAGLSFGSEFTVILPALWSQPEKSSAAP